MGPATKASPSSAFQVSNPSFFPAFPTFSRTRCDVLPVSFGGIVFACSETDGIDLIELHYLSNRLLCSRNRTTRNPTPPPAARRPLRCPW